MTTFTIIGTTKGAPDNSQETLLHIYDQTLATGARVAQGDGTGLGLVVWENAIGVENGSGFHSKITTGATANREVVLPDAAGTIVLGNGSGIDAPISFQEGFKVFKKVVGTTVENATTSAVDVSDLDFTPEADGVYRFEYLLRIQSTGTGTDVQIDIDGPGETEEVVAGYEFHRGSAISTDAQEQQAFSAFPAALDGATVAAADTGQLLQVTGLLVMSSSAATSDLVLKLRASNTSNTAKIMKGSALIIEKLN